MGRQWVDDVLGPLEERAKTIISREWKLTIAKRKLNTNEEVGKTGERLQNAYDDYSSFQQKQQDAKEILLAISRLRAWIEKYNIPRYAILDTISIVGLAYETGCLKRVNFLTGCKKGGDKGKKPKAIFQLIEYCLKKCPEQTVKALWKFLRKNISPKIRFGAYYYEFDRQANKVYEILDGQMKEKPISKRSFYRHYSEFKKKI